jgi:hypothetical protein
VVARVVSSGGASVGWGARFAQWWNGAVVSQVEQTEEVRECSSHSSFWW